jgi:hypothetical protein
MKACRGSVRKPEDRLEDLCIAGKIILKWILKKFNGMSWTGFIWLRIGKTGRLLWVWR